AAPSSLAAAAAPWRLPAPLSRTVTLATGGRLLVLGGLDAAGGSTAAVLSIQPSTGAVARAGRLRLPTHDAAGAILGGTAFVFGGGAAMSIDDVQAFRPGPGAGGEGGIAGHLPRPRSDVVAATSGAEAMLAGGYDGQSAALSVLATTDGSHFRVLGRLPHAVRYAAAAVLGRYLYVIGGEWSGRPVPYVQRLDLATGGAAVVGGLAVPTGHAAALVLDGELWVLGGRTAVGATDAILRMDPGGTGFQPAGRLPAPVSDAGAAVLGGVGYLLGGEGATALTTSVVELRPGR
ncbi:MAG: hypothetical protein ACREPA_08105, partial [Candidatus Dormibacteraceae bacterium]